MCKKSSENLFGNRVLENVVEEDVCAWKQKKNCSEPSNEGKSLKVESEPNHI